MKGSKIYTEFKMTDIYISWELISQIDGCAVNPIRSYARVQCTFRFVEQPVYSVAFFTMKVVNRSSLTFMWYVEIEFMYYSLCRCHFFITYKRLTLHVPQLTLSTLYDVEKLFACSYITLELLSLKHSLFIYISRTQQS